ncbi:MAG: FAD-binding protein [Clostridia bacterium]
MIQVLKDLCTGCKVCMKKCPFGAISIDSKVPVFEDNCVYCGMCAKACPVDAIKIDIKSKATSNPMEFKNLWVILEVNSSTNTFKKVSLELLSEARKLADRLNQKVVAVGLFDKEPDNLMEHIGSTGCDELIRVVHKKLRTYDTEISTHIVSGLISKYKPSVVLFPATENGRDLAPRISARLRVGLTADCTALDIDDSNNLIQIRPTYGGNIMASIITPDYRPQMASIRPNVFSIDKVENSHPVEVTDIQIEIGKEAGRVEYIGFQEKDTVFKDVSEAEIVICGGYGMENAENFKLLHELAVKTGAAVGATRKAVDEGWVPFEVQIGQTGKTIAPDLYIACGVSGALQHSISLKNAKKIIAINNDPAAPIFTMSDLAIMGDVKQVLIKLIEMASKDGKAVFGADNLAKL